MKINDEYIIGYETMLTVKDTATNFKKYLKN